MRLYSRAAVFACLAALALYGGAIGGNPSPEKQRVYNLLSGYEPGGYMELIKLGEKAFPAYEALLSNPKADPDMVGRTLLVIGDVKADRRRFVKHAVSRLMDTKFGNRLNAVALLKDIGSPAEASPVVALLSDKDKPVVYMAAKTLAAIGGPQEVVAMDVWLRGVSHRDDADLRKHIQKCRDALKKRLDEARAKDPSK